MKRHKTEWLIGKVVALFVSARLQYQFVVVMGVVEGAEVIE